MPTSAFWLDDERWDEFFETHLGMDHDEFLEETSRERASDVLREDGAREFSAHQARVKELLLKKLRALVAWAVDEFVVPYAQSIGVIDSSLDAESASRVFLDAFADGAPSAPLTWRASPRAKAIAASTSGAAPTQN